MHEHRRQKFISCVDCYQICQYLITYDYKHVCETKHMFIKYESQRGVAAPAPAPIPTFLPRKNPIHGAPALPPHLSPLRQ